MRRTLAFSLLSLFFLAGCSKDESNPVNPQPETPSVYAGSWKDSVMSGSGLEYAIITYTGSGTNASLAGPGYLKFRKLGTSSTTIERNLNPMGLVRNDSLILTFSSANDDEWQFKGKINSTTGRVDGELKMRFKSYPFVADTTYKMNMSLKKQ
ncbi:MAG: hypothetical protein HBSAPP04_05780 [Ignavibacteriaceae bacterium]|nr:MAG: hypothetical protein EDM75_06450 [Chlorobiota bacterium]GJQ31739.1 MAG: hypothetical protein HBSAPP04_05780 [Ignavibacteriaceae bacterium]